jgi:4-amino-4-deoxy-L-arabinose transferase-like glycosyltransferase
MLMSILRLPLRIGNPILSLTGITLCKVVLFLVLAKSGYVQPYVGGSAHNYFLPTADSIVTTGTFGDPDAAARRTKIAPGYAVFVALVRFIGADQYLYILVGVQMVLDYCVALLLLFLGSRETSIEAGWLAGVLWLVFPPAVVVSSWVASEPLATSLLTLSIVMLIRSFAQHGGGRLSFAAGLSLGVTTLVRAATQLLPLVLLAVAFLDPTHKRRLKCLLVLLGMCLVIFPWTLRNLYVVREPIIIQTGYGPLFFMGSRSEYFTIDGVKEDYLNLQQRAAEDGLVRPTDGRVTSRDRWIFRLGLREYRLRLEQEPLSFLPFLLHKFARLWYGTETGMLYKQLFLGICSLLTVPIGLYQIWRWREDRPHLSGILTLLCLYFMALLLVNLPAFRYMLPLFPLLIFAASHQYIKLYQSRIGTRA